MICENFSFAKCFFEWSVKVMMNKLIKRKAYVDKLKIILTLILLKYTLEADNVEKQFNA